MTPELRLLSAILAQAVVGAAAAWPLGMSTEPLAAMLFASLIIGVAAPAIQVGAIAGLVLEAYPPAIAGTYTVPHNPWQVLIFGIPPAVESSSIVEVYSRGIAGFVAGTAAIHLGCVLCCAPVFSCATATAPFLAAVHRPTTSPLPLRLALRAQ